MKINSSSHPLFRSPESFLDSSFFPKESRRRLETSENFWETAGRSKVGRCGFFFSSLRSPENIDCADTRVDTRHLDTFGCI